MDNLEEIVEIYFDVTQEFKLQDRLQFKYSNKHSKDNGILVKYIKMKGVCYIPFIKKGYRIKLDLN